MRGKVAVITGAAGGIGHELCRVVITLGGTVIAMDRNETRFNMLRDDNGGGSDIICLPTQHEDLESVARSANKIKKKNHAPSPLISL